MEGPGAGIGSSVPAGTGRLPAPAGTKSAVFLVLAAQGVD